MPGLIASINTNINVGGAIKIFDFAWLFGVSSSSSCCQGEGTSSLRSFAQFFVASTVYSALSLGFPAKETYIPEAIISEEKNVGESTESEKSSHHDVMEGDVKLV